MEVSYFLAQLMGLSITIFAVIGIIRPRIVTDAIRTFEANSLTSLFFGFTAIVVSLAIILNHNIWELSWVGVVTLFGWLGLLKGIAYLLAPQVLLSSGLAMYKTSTNIRAVLILALLLGLYLSYTGFAL